MSMMDMTERIRSQAYMYKLMPAEKAAELIHPGAKVGMSGFTPAGYPKAVPLALAQCMKHTPFQIDLWTGGSVGDEIDGALSRVNGIRRRYPYQANAELRRHVNDGSTAYADMHISILAQQLREGFFGSLDIAVVEAAAITENGDLVPTTSIGITPTIVACCRQVIVEVNVTKPLSLEGMHDVYELKNPPFRAPISISRVQDRIGSPYSRCGWDKIAAIVLTDIPDTPRELKPATADAEAMSAHIIDFFRQEVRAGRMPQNLLPLQSGVGSAANAVIRGLAKSDFQHLSIYTEVLQDGMFDLIDAGKVDAVSTAAISTSAAGTKHFYENIERYRKSIVLRPQELSNHPEIIRRLGVIALNTAIEFDIYGNVNSTHFYGSRIMNGIGGSGDFARSAFLSIFCTSSIAKNGAVSAVVPMCPHIDHTEHDVQILCTEQGIADLRGLCPQERARRIIERCAHPDYRPQLTDYLERAISSTNSAHTPMLLDEALSWHKRFISTGTMLY